MGELPAETTLSHQQRPRRSSTSFGKTINAHQPIDRPRSVGAGEEAGGKEGASIHVCLLTGGDQHQVQEAF